MSTSRGVIDQSAQVLARMPTGEALRRLVGLLVRLLAEGQPVTVGAIATAAGLRPDEVDTTLAGFTDVEWDEQDRVVGLGLSLRPTEHRITIGGRTLYAGCAYDTLLMAVLLECRVTINSPDFSSPQTVQVEADGQRVIAVQPPTAVISMAGLDPDAAKIDSIRSASCVNGHFFGSPEAAAGWLAGHPGGRIMSVAEAHEVARQMAADFFA